MSFNPPPEPNYDRNTDVIIRYYKQAISSIVYTLRTQDLNQLDRAMQKKLLQEIGLILKDLDKNAKEWIKENIPQAYMQGQATTLVTIGEASTMDEAMKLLSFSAIHKEFVNALISDTYEDLLQMTTNTEKKIRQTVREVFGEQLRAKAAENLGRRTMTRDTVQDLKARLGESGQFAIKDRANRVWKVEDYVNVVVRTKIQQAHVEGVRNQAAEREVYLGVISSHGAKDACRFHEGRIVKLVSSAPGNYPTIEELRNSSQIFHPNCKHSVFPVRSPDLLPPSVRDKAEQQAELGQRAISTGKRNPKGV